jgi:N4-gp56 family major capsid protein
VITLALPTVASVLSSGLAAYPTIYYDRVALDALYSNLFMYSACDLKTMPDRSGVAMQIFDYTAMTANTTPATEGTPASSGQPLTQNVRSINLSNFIDFVSISSQVKMTAISDVVSEAASLLAYRGALSIDTVISTAVDTAAAADSTARIDVADGSFLSAAKVRQAVWQLRASNVKPKDNGLFLGISPSLAVFDLCNESGSGSLLDLQKFADSTAPSNQALVGIKGAMVGNIGGALFYESNALSTTANWQSSGKLAYSSYIFGKNAFIASSLGKTGLDQKNFSVTVRDFPMGSNSLDLGGLVAAAAVYNAWFGVTKTTGGISKYRKLRSESSIG